MPMASLDKDEKYKNLIETFLNLQINRLKNDQNNNNDADKINYKIFDNILESLVWLTEGGDRKLKMQITAEDENKHPLNTSNFSGSENEKINVLITGSLYLVGLSLKVLDYKTIN